MAIVTAELAAPQWGRVLSISPGATKPVTVQFRGQPTECLVSEDLRSQFIAGNLAVGDWVLVVPVVNGPIITDILYL